MHWTPRRTPAFNFSLKAAQKSRCFSRVYVGVYVTHPLTLTCTPVPHTTNSLARSLTHYFAHNPSHSLPLVCADQGVEGWTQARVRTGAGGVNDGTYSTDTVREAAKWLQTALDGGQPSANLHGAPHRLMRAKRTRRWHISESTSPGVCNGDVKHALPLANARRAHAIAHVLPLPCGEVLRIADHEKMASKQASLSATLTSLNSHVFQRNS